MITWTEGNRDPNLNILLDANNEAIGCIMSEGNHLVWHAFAADGAFLGTFKGKGSKMVARAAVEAAA